MLYFNPGHIPTVVADSAYHSTENFSNQPIQEKTSCEIVLSPDLSDVCLVLQNAKSVVRRFHYKNTTKLHYFKVCISGNLTCPQSMSGKYFLSEKSCFKYSLEKSGNYIMIYSIKLFFPSLRKHCYFKSNIS